MPFGTAAQHSAVPQRRRDHQEQRVGDAFLQEASCDELPNSGGHPRGHPRQDPTAACAEHRSQPAVEDAHPLRIGRRGRGVNPSWWSGGDTSSRSGVVVGEGLFCDMALAGEEGWRGLAGCGVGWGQPRPQRNECSESQIFGVIQKLRAFSFCGRRAQAKREGGGGDPFNPFHPWVSRCSCD